MRNPFRSETRAFWFVLAVAAAAATVAVADVLAPTAVLIAVSVLAIVGVAGLYLLRGPARQRIPAAPAHVGSPSERRALLLVDELTRDVSSVRLRHPADRVLVVSLAGTSPVRHWLSDVDPARARAHRRMEDAVSRLHDQHVDASGVIGDEDPFNAIDDALRTFGGDEIVVASDNPELITRLRNRYAIPVAPAGAA
jgi:cytochrome oxidase Cu insertion factor (SCO1/SenC/PrrC family)